MEVKNRVGGATADNENNEKVLAEMLRPFFVCGSDVDNT